MFLVLWECECLSLCVCVGNTTTKRSICSDSNCRKCSETSSSKFYPFNQHLFRVRDVISTPAIRSGIQQKHIRKFNLHRVFALFQRISIRDRVTLWHSTGWFCVSKMLIEWIENVCWYTGWYISQCIYVWCR